MNSFMVAFGLSSIALLIGVALRAKVGFLRNMLVPSSVIAGIIGFIFMNVVTSANLKIGTDYSMFTTIVNNLFTISFISISLTGSSRRKDNTAKNIANGSFGMGLIWDFLYALTPLLGFGIILVIGKAFGMDAIYGTLIPFAFCQGPGQAAAFGTLYEQFGWDNAVMVAVTFAAIGFVAAFGIGIPIAKAGIRKGIAKNCGELDSSILKGYLTKEEQTNYMVKDTTCNSNIETLTYHFAVIGICYVGAIGISKLFALIPGFFGTSMSGLMFMNGMFAAYIIKFIMKKLHIDFLLEDVLQTKITGWTADYLVVCAFMAINFQVIAKWSVPIIVECVIMTVVTYFVCLYFGRRIGGSNDFERTLGIYGTCTGTVPSGIALVRIVDPEFKTTTSIELGLCNLVMMFSTPVYIVLLGYASGSMSTTITLLILAALVPVYMILMKVFRCWGKPTYSWKKAE